MSSDDFAIYLTPEGELYDSSSVDNLKESNDAKNIKRENKVCIKELFYKLGTQGSKHSFSVTGIYYLSRLLMKTKMYRKCNQN
jgi:hypothetical protein